jgi:hypothetical protein
LSSVTLGKEGSTHSQSAKPSMPSTFSRALGKDFAECQEVLGKEKQPSRRWVTKTTSLPSVLGDTRQRSYLCRVSAGQHSVKNPSVGPHVRFFAECFVWHSAKRVSLPSARAITLGKEPIPVPRSWFFVECCGPDTQQNDQYTPF